MGVDGTSRDMSWQSGDVGQPAAGLTAPAPAGGGGGVSILSGQKGGSEMRRVKWACHTAQRTAKLALEPSSTLRDESCFTLLRLSNDWFILLRSETLILNVDGNVHRTNKSRRSVPPPHRPAVPQVSASCEGLKVRVS